MGKPIRRKRDIENVDVGNGGGVFSHQIMGSEGASREVPECPGRQKMVLVHVTA